MSLTHPMPDDKKLWQCLCEVCYIDGKPEAMEVVDPIRGIMDVPMCRVNQKELREALELYESKN